MIIDTHAHYDDEAFDPDREVLLASMQEHGIEKIDSYSNDDDNNKSSSRYEDTDTVVKSSYSRNT